MKRWLSRPHRERGAGMELEKGGQVYTERWSLQEEGITREGRYYTDTCGQGRGAAIIDVSLGTPPYSYLWKPDSITTAIHYNLPA
ncbi:MAG: hypothetical protein GC178_09730, partial [Flavobacteriales bacterium]|nr:hypothetical protein [Flavobacteriales bacterium]